MISWYESFRSRYSTARLRQYLLRTYSVVIVRTAAVVYYYSTSWFVRESRKSPILVCNHTIALVILLLSTVGIIDSENVVGR
jgi:hypothetical protein